MKKLVLGLPNSVPLAKSIAKRAKAEFSEAYIKSFPDGETYLRFMKDVKGKIIYIVQTLHPNPNKSLMELFFAIYNAKDLGARKVHVFIPYLAYMRQDKRFKSRECVSSKAIAKFLRHADSLTTIDPHLHRIKNLSQIYKIKTKVLHAAPVLADFIKENFKKQVLVGPDIESHQWVSAIAKRINHPFIVLRKKRFSSRKVKISLPNYSIKGKKAILIDDIVSSGYTIAETAKVLKKKGASSVSIICVHGIFAENALSKLKKAGLNKIICTNTIQNTQTKIDISKLFSSLI